MASKTPPSQLANKRQKQCCSSLNEPPPKTDYGTTYKTYHNGMNPTKRSDIGLKTTQPPSSGPFGIPSNQKFPDSTQYRQQYLKKPQKKLQPSPSDGKLFPNTGTTYGPTYLCRADLPPLQQHPSMKLLSNLPPTTYTNFFVPKLGDLKTDIPMPQPVVPQMKFLGSTSYDNHYIQHPIRQRMDKIYNYKNRCKLRIRAKEYI